MSDGGGVLQSEGARFLQERMSPMVKLAKARLFLDWLEFECATKDVADRPSASQILREFKRITGFLSYNDPDERHTRRGYDPRSPSGY